jgi:MFS family permease
MDTAADTTQRENTSKLPGKVWAILGIVLIADIMDLLDSTITTIAAPTIAARLHGGADLIKWLGASYALSLGVLLITGGRLGDKYGRRRAWCCRPSSNSRGGGGTWSTGWRT